MKTTKRELVRKAMYRLAEKTDMNYEIVELIKELGKVYDIDVYDKDGLVDGETVVVGTQIEDDWYLNKGFKLTDEFDKETYEPIFERV